MRRRLHRGLLVAIGLAGIMVVMILGGEATTVLSQNGEQFPVNQEELNGQDIESIPHLLDPDRLYPRIGLALERIRGTFADGGETQFSKFRSRGPVSHPQGAAFEAAGSAPVPGAGVPTTSGAFPGLNRQTASSCGFAFFPPDNILAVGPDQILEAGNSALRLTNKAGSQIQLQTLNDHFGVPVNGAGNRVLFDPKVAYDSASGRFFIVALQFTPSFFSAESKVFLSVSRGSNLTSLNTGWCNYAINAKLNSTGADYPGLGFSDDAVAISTNQFAISWGGFGSFQNVALWVLRKASLVNNAAGCPALTSFLFIVTTDASGQRAFTLQPAQSFSSTAAFTGKPQFFVSAFPTGTSSATYVLWRVINVATTPSLSKVNLAGGQTYSFPPDATQKGAGSKLDTSDVRVKQVAFRGGSLWATHATGCTVGGVVQSCIRALRITPSNAGGTIAFQSTLAKGAGQFVYQPAIGVNNSGDVLLAFLWSSANQFLSFSAALKYAAASTFTLLPDLAVGNCAQTATDRTGDYTGLQPDPSELDKFWTVGERASAFAVGATTCNWQNTVAAVVP